MAHIMEGAEPFLLPGGKKGALLVHGFTGAPAEMRLIGEYLHGLGYTVLVPRLSGHGTSPEEMAATDWRHWYHSVCDAYYLLRGLCDSVSVAGLSMGGLLAIRLGIDFEVEKVASLSAPIYIADRKIELLPPLPETIGKFVPKKRRRIAGIPERYNVAYRKTPMNCIHSLLSLIDNVTELLPELHRPLLVVQSKEDHTVAFESGDFLYRRAGSQIKETVWLERSGHLVTLDEERDEVFRAVGRFFKS